MIGFVTQIVELELEVLTPLGLGTHTGLALRGAIFDSMRNNLNVCLYKHLKTCQPCSLRQVCPLAGILATVDDDAPRGHDVPRPIAIRPPIDGRRVYQPGDRIRFGVTLFGDGGKYVPYIVLAARELERSGLGLLLSGDRRGPPTRGGVRLDTVHAVHPLTDERQGILQKGDSVVRPGNLYVTSVDVENYASTLPPDSITLDLLTPMRLVQTGHLVRPLRFDALIWRLLDRLKSLTAHYSQTAWILDTHALVGLARSIQTQADATRWIDLDSHSSRTGRRSPTGGLVGSITFRGDLAPFLPLLVWGNLVHVGKSVTRGNGWYRIVPEATVETRP